MAKLIINEEIELEIFSFNQNINQTDNETKTYLGVQLNIENINDSFTQLLKDYLAENSINKIEILDNEEVSIYSSEMYDHICNISINMNFTVEEPSVNGYINFVTN